MRRHSEHQKRAKHVHDVGTPSHWTSWYKNHHIRLRSSSFIFFFFFFGFTCKFARAWVKSVVFFVRRLFFLIFTLFLIDFGNFPSTTNPDPWIPPIMVETIDKINKFRDMMLSHFFALTVTLLKNGYYSARIKHDEVHKPKANERLVCCDQAMCG